MKKEFFYLSNLLSLFRMLLAIPLWILLSQNNFNDNRILIGSLCLFAAITDVLDGFLARKLNQVSEFGKIIDPLADKVCVGILILKLFLLDQIPIYYLTIILGRDLLILVGGIITSKKLKKVIPSNYIGKATVITISLSLLFIIFGMAKTNLIFLSMFFSSILLSFISLFSYSINAYKLLNLRNEHI
jgi:CDP-diacylglycerol--glycerol-3-phosphate 3-phosphatidyltransferase